MIDDFLNFSLQTNTTADQVGHALGNLINKLLPQKKIIGSKFSQSLIAYADAHTESGANNFDLLKNDDETSKYLDKIFEEETFNMLNDIKDPMKDKLREFYISVIGTKLYEDVNLDSDKLEALDFNNKQTDSVLDRIIQVFIYDKSKEITQNNIKENFNILNYDIFIENLKEIIKFRNEKINKLKRAGFAVINKAISSSDDNDLLDKASNRLDIIARILLDGGASDADLKDLTDDLSKRRLLSIENDGDNAPELKANAKLFATLLPYLTQPVAEEQMKSYLVPSNIAESGKYADYILSKPLQLDGISDDRKKLLISDALVYKDHPFEEEDFKNIVADFENVANLPPSAYSSYPLSEHAFKVYPFNLSNEDPHFDALRDAAFDRRLDKQPSDSQKLGNVIDELIDTTRDDEQLGMDYLPFKFNNILEELKKGGDIEATINFTPEQQKHFLSNEDTDKLVEKMHVYGGNLIDPEMPITDVLPKINNRTYNVKKLGELWQQESPKIEKPALEEPNDEDIDYERFEPIGNNEDKFPNGIQDNKDTAQTTNVIKNSDDKLDDDELPVQDQLPSENKNQTGPESNKPSVINYDDDEMVDEDGDEKPETITIDEPKKVILPNHNEVNDVIGNLTEELREELKNAEDAQQSLNPVRIVQLEDGSELEINIVFVDDENSPCYGNNEF